jgi:hypothetical protein
MFEFLNPYRVVLVVGPTRSGTTIAGHIIAQDTGKHYLDDTAEAIWSTERLRALVAKYDNIVIQCPTLTWYVDEFGDCDDIAIVLMRRNVDEIRESNDRALKQFRVPSVFWGQGYSEYRGKCELIEAIYDHWENVQKHKIKHPFEINYCDLAAHGLWVERDIRRSENWSFKSWKVRPI